MSKATTPLPLGNPNVDQLVQSYLKKRGYKSAETALRREANLAQQPHSSSSSLLPPQQSSSVDQFVFDSSLLDVDSTVVESILSCYNPAESNQPKLIIDSYKRVKSWVDDSLDLYKVSLRVTEDPVT